MDDKTDAAATLKAAPQMGVEDPDKPLFFLVAPVLMQQIIKRLGNMPAKKVHGLLNNLNACRTVQTDLPDK